ncbi:hypothetical protein PoB_004783600 [Plakobranchus ocellatus]|uniref:Uncharacterized protein n=1 Tax=Plakobranchus ocellatus TaxID=259542 RepID=A0AAV4BQJ8_9GAST|nr:hypothetical protein PoB_004783600 [Plakobranchus ocellatus]
MDCRVKSRTKPCDNKLRVLTKTGQLVTELPGIRAGSASSTFRSLEKLARSSSTLTSHRSEDCTAWGLKRCISTPRRSSSTLASHRTGDCTAWGLKRCISTPRRSSSTLASHRTEDCTAWGLKRCIF